MTQTRKALLILCTLFLISSVILLIYLGSLGFWFNNSTFRWVLAVVGPMVLSIYFMRRLKGSDKNLSTFELTAIVTSLVWVYFQSNILNEAHLKQNSRNTFGVVYDKDVIKGTITAYAKFKFENKVYKASKKIEEFRDLNIGDTVKIVFSPIHPLISRIE